MALTRRDLLKALIRPGGLKGLTVTMQPGGFVTELRSLRPGALSADSASLADTMTRNELVFACLDIKARCAQDPRLAVEQQVTKGGKTTYEPIADHPMRALMNAPNKDMGEADLMRAAFVSWDVSNPRRFYAEREVDGSGALIGLHPLNPVYMRPKQSRDRARTTIGYIWDDGQQRREYSLEELLIRSAPAWYAPPPLPSALGSIESDTAQTDYVRAFFEGGGVPPGLLKYNRPLGQDERDDLRQQWLAQYGNAYGRQHGVGILDVNAEYQQTGVSLDKLSSETLRSVAESRICMVFGVPPLIVYAYVGLLRATYSNLKEAWSGFWDATMSPAFKEWRDFWQRALLSEYETEADIAAGRVRLSYDMSLVAALQDDVDLIQKRARENFAAGIISQNEARAAAGYTPIAGGETTFRVSAAASTTTPPPPPTTSGAGKAAKDRDGATVQFIERRIEREVRGYLASEYRAAAAAVRSE